jgi:hypothetical protein
LTGEQRREENTPSFLAATCLLVHFPVSLRLATALFMAGLHWKNLPDAASKNRHTPH